jgi:hypothetical protein
VPDFTTDGLLYPLTKGDKPGHTFHGNQYKDVASEGETSSLRRPAGYFQLTGSEIISIGAELAKNVETMGQTKAHDLAAVKISKMLGLDKPAKEVATPPNQTPDLYRGCSKEGAESLTKPLEHYGKSGGAAWGNGVYTGTDRPTAEQYVDGAMVKIWVDPEAKIASGQDVLEGYRSFDAFTDDLVLPYVESDAFTHFAYQPANIALLLGYQGVNDKTTFVVLDRSVMTISTELRQPNKDFSY